MGTHLGTYPLPQSERAIPGRWERRTRPLAMDGKDTCGRTAWDTADISPEEPDVTGLCGWQAGFSGGADVAWSCAGEESRSGRDSRSAQSLRPYAMRRLFSLCLLLVVSTSLFPVRAVAQPQPDTSRVSSGGGLVWGLRGGRVTHGTDFRKPLGIATAVSRGS